MAYKSTKHASTQQVQLIFSGGVNYADPPSAIAPTQMQECLNVLYLPGEDVPAVRPGLAYVAAAPTGSPQILALHSYVKGVAGSYLVGAFSDGKVRWLNGATWDEITTLTSAGVVPAFLTFHDKLLIGDPGSGGGIKTWDGTTVTSLAGSPRASALLSVGGRVAANSVTDLDAVVFSAVQDETKWALVDGGELVRVGYGNGYSVTGLGEFSGDLVVWMASSLGGACYRVLNVAQDTSTWAVAHIANTLPLSSGRAATFVANNFLFGTTTGGIFDLAGVQQYGDIQVGVAGRNINPRLQGKQITELRFLSAFGVALAFASGDYRVYAYHPHNQAWTVLAFPKPMVCATQYGGNVYLAASDGTLYRLTSADSRDETAPATYAEITSMLRSQQMVAPGSVILRRCRQHYESLSGGSMTMSVVGPDALNTTQIQQITSTEGTGMLFEATAKLADATQKMGVSSRGYIDGRARVRAQSLAVEIKSTAGRYRLRETDLEFAQVAG